MLKKILSLEKCAACRNCCVFHEESRWETPVVSKEKAEMIKDKIQQDECVFPHKNGYTIASVKRNTKLNEGDEPYRCIALDEKKGCTLSSKEKPFDCSLWPLRVMKHNENVYITLAKGCFAVDDTFVKKVNKLLIEGLKEQILNEIKNNPDIIKDFSENYIVLCDITEEI